MSAFLDLDEDEVDFCVLLADCVLLEDALDIELGDLDLDRRLLFEMLDKDGAMLGASPEVVAAKVAMVTMICY